MRRSDDTRHRQPGGFTLIELLLALMMFGIVSAAVFASFAAISNGVEKGRESAEIYQVGRGALHHIIQELTAAYRFHQTACQEDSPSYICEPLKGEDGSVDGMAHDRLTFLTIHSRQFTEGVSTSTICNVCYYIGQNASGTSALFRHEDCTLDADDDDRCSGEQEPLELTDAVVGLAVTYYDTKESEAHETWPPDHPDGSLPCRVHVELTLRRTLQDERLATTVWLPMGGACEEER